MRDQAPLPPNNSGLERGLPSSTTIPGVSTCWHTGSIAPAEHAASEPRSVQRQFPTITTKSSPLNLTRTEILVLFALKGNYQSYLEIGVQNPKEKFDLIPIREKIGVNPEPSAGATFCTTSDAFFAANNKPFDVIFVDGMHEATQAMRDIENSLRVLRPGGTIMVHDCNPSTKEMQLVPIQADLWTGNVWKAWVMLRSHHDNLSLKVVDTDYGCGIIREGVNQRLDEPDLKGAKLSWENFVAHRAEWLNLISPEEFLATEFPGPRVWDDLVIATVGIDTEDFSNYLLESVRMLGNCPVIWRWGTGETCLAREYNKVLRSASQRYVLFVHPAVEFTPDFLIYSDLAFRDPQVGAVGFYGCGMDGLHWRGGPKKSWKCPPRTSRIASTFLKASRIWPPPWTLVAYWWTAPKVCFSTSRLLTVCTFMSKISAFSRAPKAAPCWW